MKRCEARVWDNGDMIDCGSALPCPNPSHSSDELYCENVLTLINRIIYEPSETYENRRARLNKIIDLVREKKFGGG